MQTNSSAEAELRHCHEAICPANLYLDATKSAPCVCKRTCVRAYCSSFEVPVISDRIVRYKNH